MTNNNATSEYFMRLRVNETFKELELDRDVS